MNCNNKLSKINLVQHIKQFILCFKYHYRTDIGPADIAYFVINTYFKTFT